MTGAQRVEIAGTVEGNVLSISETVTVRGPVGKSLHSFAQHVGLAPEGRVEGDVFAFAEESDLDGHVGRDLLAWSGLTNLRGEVARNFSAWTGRLRVEGPARIGGDIVAHVDKKEAVFVDPGASVGGKTETRLPVDQGSRFSDPGFYRLEGRLAGRGPRDRSPPPPPLSVVVRGPPGRCPHPASLCGDRLRRPGRGARGDRPRWAHRGRPPRGFARTGPLAGGAVPFPDPRERAPGPDGALSARGQAALPLP